MSRRSLAVRTPEDWGIQPVPVERRRLRPFDLGVLWGDLAVSLLVMVAGALLVPGLGTKATLLAIFVGTLLGTVLLSLAGIVGSDTGMPTIDRKSTRLNSSHIQKSRMPSSA